MCSNLKVTTTSLPSYLKLMLREDFSIKLVHKESYLNGQLTVVKCEEKDEESVQGDLSLLELTGTPLETDLGADDSVDSVLIIDEPISWTTQEAAHYPTTLKEARAFINAELKSKRPNDEIKQKPIYCICDGTDSKKTVILGTNLTQTTFMTTIVHVLPCCEEDHELTSIEYMEKQHLKNVLGNAAVKCCVMKCYYLYGYNLTNHSHLRTSQINGSIAIEVFSQEISQNQNNSEINMNLQVIVGHNNSPLNLFWKDLCRLQSYMEILGNKQHNEKSVIATNSLECSQIVSMVIDLLSDVNYFKKSSNKELDLENLRQENILDKMWVILKQCENVSDLRDCFHAFFEELTVTQARLQILNEDNSAIGEIVNGILDGKFAVPTLTFSQSLQYFIELGFEKLLNDYVTIINSFYPFAQESILKHWRNLCATEEVANSNQTAKRRTRISVNLKSAVTDIMSYKHKWLYLESLHTVAEFMLLCREHTHLSEENFDHFCESLCTKYVEKFCSIKVPLMLKTHKLNEFSFKLLPLDSSNIQDKHPASFSVNMSSSYGSSEVTTVFYFSEHPIFPPAIYSDYNLNLDNIDGGPYYVSKLVRFIEYS